MSYATELERHEQIIEAPRRGMKISEISQKHRVGERIVYRLIQQQQETGDIKSRKGIGKRPVLSDDDIEGIRELILSKSYITIADVKEELGLTVGISAIYMVITEKLGFQKLYVQTNSEAEIQRAANTQESAAESRRLCPVKKVGRIKKAFKNKERVAITRERW